MFLNQLLQSLLILESDRLLQYRSVIDDLDGRQSLNLVFVGEVLTLVHVHEDQVVAAVLGRQLHQQRLDFHARRTPLSPEFHDHTTFLAKLLSLRVSFWVMYVRHKIIIFIILFIFLILYFYLYHFSFLKSALKISITIFVKYMLY
jgi:hypothetical protein